MVRLRRVVLHDSCAHKSLSRLTPIPTPASDIFIYNNFVAESKFSLPDVPLAPEERALWASVTASASAESELSAEDNTAAQEHESSTSAVTASGNGSVTSTAHQSPLGGGGGVTMSSSQFFETLESLKESGVALSAAALDLLALEGTEEREAIFATLPRSGPPTQRTVVTCIGVLRRSVEEGAGVGCLVIGTEAGGLLVLSPSCRDVLRMVQLPSAPVFLECLGTFDGTYRVVVALRTGRVVTVGGTTVATLVELEAPASAMCRCEKVIVLAATNMTITGVHTKGTTVFTTNVESPVVAMAAITASGVRANCAYVVALKNCTLTVYSRDVPLNTTSTPAPVSSLRFGPYAREAAALILTLANGHVVIRTLSRFAVLDADDASAVAAAAASDPGAAGALAGAANGAANGRLVLPKKTTVWVEQLARERTFAVDIHRALQRDLCAFRLRALREFTRIVTSSATATAATTAAAAIRVTADLSGLGPRFRIRVQLQNNGAKSAAGYDLVIYGGAKYRATPPVSHLPLLVPTLAVTVDVVVDAVAPDDAPGDVRVLVVASVARRGLTLGGSCLVPLLCRCRALLYS